MSDSVKKISAEDLETLKQLNTRKQELNEQIVRLGWLEIDLKLGKTRNEEEAIAITNLEREITGRFTSEYGDIQNLDFETGEYTTA